MTAHQHTISGGGLATGPRAWLRRRTGLAVALTLAATVLISASWLVFPYFVEGELMLFDVGADVQQSRRVRAGAIAGLLTRVADGPGPAEVDVLFATRRYFAMSDRAGVVAEYRPDRYLVFIVNETTHTIDLPAAVVTATLIVDGVAYAPADIDGPPEPTHHRVTKIRFPRFDAAGRPVIGPGARTLELRLTNHWAEMSTAASTRTATWRLPIAYPEESAAGAPWTPVMVMALSAGLLSAVLTPCLLQLLVIYFVTVTGLGVEAIGRGAAVPADAGRRIFRIALVFVVSFVALYTLAGAVIGYVGHGVQALSAEWSRPVSIVSGILIILLGLWVGAKAGAPLVCRIPVPAAMKRLDRGGFASSAFMAAGFSLGCMTCFSGAIVATLMIYVGALGSASVGAMVLFTFSLGVAIPFLAAAAFLSRAMPLLGRVSAYAPMLAFASMVVIMAFGLVLITNNFHTLSNAIYPLLGLR